MTGPEQDIAARAEQVMAEAAALPSPGELRDLADRAVRHGGTRNMSLNEIREIAGRAVEGLEQVTDLLRRLSQLTDEPPDEPGGRQ